LQVEGKFFSRVIRFCKENTCFPGELGIHAKKGSGGQNEHSQARVYIFKNVNFILMKFLFDSFSLITIDRLV
jgi:hypothetical protein